MLNKELFDYLAEYGYQSEWDEKITPMIEMFFNLAEMSEVDNTQFGSFILQILNKAIEKDIIKTGGSAYAVPKEDEEAKVIEADDSLQINSDICYDGNVIYFQMDQVRAKDSEHFKSDSTSSTLVLEASEN